LRSRRRVGWCEFSARLFRRKPCLWRAVNLISDFAAPPTIGALGFRECGRGRLLSV
jgi:hypothetical protein